jgi:hypothetical protein
MSIIRLTVRNTPSINLKVSNAVTNIYYRFDSDEEVTSEGLRSSMGMGRSGSEAEMESAVGDFSGQSWETPDGAIHFWSEGLQRWL